MATLPELLKTLVDNDGSDLHLTTQTPPQIRVHGKMQVLDLPPLGAADTKAHAPKQGGAARGGATAPRGGQKQPMRVGSLVSPARSARTNRRAQG